MFPNLLVPIKRVCFFSTASYRHLFRRFLASEGFLRTNGVPRIVDVSVLQHRYPGGSNGISKRVEPSP